MRSPGLFAFFILSLFWLDSSLAAENLGPIGKVDEIQGRAMIARSNGTNRDQWALSDGSELLEGDEITTAKGSFVTIELNQTGTLTIGEESFYRLTYHHADESRGTVQSLTKLLYGRVRAAVKKLQRQKGASFEVHTPNAVMGVRGTDFVVGFDPAGRLSQVTTIEGEVGLKSARFAPDGLKPLQTSPEVVISKGQSVTVTGVGNDTQMPQIRKPEPVEPEKLEALKKDLVKPSDENTESKLEKMEALDKMVEQRPETDFFYAGIYYDHRANPGGCTGTKCYNAESFYGGSLAWTTREPGSMLSYGWLLTAALMQIKNTATSNYLPTLGGGFRLNVHFGWGFFLSLDLVPLLSMANFSIPIVTSLRAPLMINWEYVFESGFRLGLGAGGTGLVQYFWNLSAPYTTRVGSAFKYTFAPSGTLFLGFSY